MGALGTTPRSRLTLTLALTLGLLVAIGARRAAAVSECMQDAKAQRGECYAACDEDFTIARDICRNIDPVCAAGCRTELGNCRAPIITALESCVDACRAQLETERAACPRKGRARGFCIDRAQIRAFLCRDECRADLQVRSGLNACRAAYRTCMNGCGIPTEPTPVATPAPQPTEPPPAATRTAPPQPGPTLTPVVPR